MKRSQIWIVSCLLSLTASVKIKQTSKVSLTLKTQEDIRQFANNVGHQALIQVDSKADCANPYGGCSCESASSYGNHSMPESPYSSWDNYGHETNDGESASPYGPSDSYGNSTNSTNSTSPYDSYNSYGSTDSYGDDSYAADSYGGNAETAVEDGCVGGWVVTNHFTSGEYWVGSAQGREGCYALASECRPGFDLINTQKSCSSGSSCSCYCQKSEGQNVKEHENDYDGWTTCKFQRNGTLAEDSYGASPYDSYDTSPYDTYSTNDTSSYGSYDSSTYDTYSTNGTYGNSSYDTYSPSSYDSYSLPTDSYSPYGGSAYDSYFPNDTYSTYGNSSYDSYSPNDSYSTYGNSSYDSYSPSPYDSYSSGNDSYSSYDSYDPYFPPSNNSQRYDGCYGDWVVTNSFSSGERHVGSVQNQQECVQKVLSECPGFDLANTNNGRQSSCFCQKSGGRSILSATRGGGWITCSVKPWTSTGDAYGSSSYDSYDSTPYDTYSPYGSSAYGYTPSPYDSYSTYANSSYDSYSPYDSYSTYGNSSYDSYDYSPYGSQNTTNNTYGNSSSYDSYESGQDTYGSAAPYDSYTSTEEQASPYDTYSSSEDEASTQPSPSPAEDDSTSAESPSECLGEWVVTNHFTSGEYNVGYATSREGCAKLGKEQCTPGYDLINTHKQNPSSCWCQKSRGNSVESKANNSDSYVTCKIR